VEQLTLAFDPRCPWCYETSRWLRHLENLGEIELDYRLYSLELAHLEKGEDPMPMGKTARSAMALRVCVAIARLSGTKAMGKFYKVLGDKVWETTTPAKDREAMTRECVVELGYPESLVDDAMADDSTWEEVVAQHQELVSEMGGVGVPSLLFPNAPRRAIFGPVICELPLEDEARKLWSKVRWFAENDNIFEIKLTKRTRHPNLPGWQVKRSQLTFGTHPWLPPESDEPDEPSMEGDACVIPLRQVPQPETSGSK
jgi:protein-disulfide isomerase-like protein with CxxC motif